MKLRDYQSDCLDAAWENLHQDAAAALAVVPTGGGKTIIFASLADRWNKQGKGRVLILAHRFELIDQAAKKFERVAGYAPGIEMADSRVIISGNLFGYGGNRVIIGSVPTMRGRRLSRWPRDFFGLIIVDEAHHATAPSYTNIFDHFNEAKLFGVTATPDRGDKKPLGKVFHSVAYQMEIRQAIDQGWLVPIRQKFVHVESIDLSEVGNNWKGDDLDTNKLDEVMMRDEAIHKVAKPTYDKAGTRPTLVFATSVRHAKAISDILNSYRKGCSEYIASYRVEEDGSERSFPEELRAEEIAKFQKGERQFLCSCGVFLEGFDAPPTAMIAMARPTKSRSLYAQALGRGTRPLDGLVDPFTTPGERVAAIFSSAKPDVLVLDFVGNSGKHKLIYADDILFPEADDETRERARKIISDKDDGESVEKAVRESEKKTQEIKEERIKSLDVLRRKLAKQLVADFYEKDVDPFGDYLPSVPSASPQRMHDEPTDKQCRYVLYLGRQVGKQYIFESIKAMPKRQVQGMIGHLQRKATVNT